MVIVLRFDQKLLLVFLQLLQPLRLNLDSVRILVDGRQFGAQQKLRVLVHEDLVRFESLISQF